MKAKQQLEKSAWKTIEETLADESGLAVIIVEGEASAVVSASNNNSVCKVLQESKEFSPMCQSFCGDAFNHVKSAGKSVNFQCHAGLNYTAVQLPQQNFVAIIGRTFNKSDDYKKATVRAISGDWKKFESQVLFENILLESNSNDAEKLGKRLENLDEDEQQSLLWLKESEIETLPDVTETERIESVEPTIVNLEKVHVEAADASAYRSHFSSLLQLSYRQACSASLKFIAKHYKIPSLVWLERKLNVLETALAGGKFKKEPLKSKIYADNDRLTDAFQNEVSLNLQETFGKNGENRELEIFPIAFGEEIRAAIVVGDEINQAQKRQISSFARKLASPLEILRLREQLEKQSWLAKAVQKFNQGLEISDSADYWTFLAQTSTELMKAERGSLLVFDENEQNLIVKASIGGNFDTENNIGNKIAKNVLASGKPLVVKDIKMTKLASIPSAGKYKSDSFISYPIMIGERKIGILNVTDKIDGGFYDEFDLELLNTIAPQLAVALDRASLQHKAGEYRQLSITDPLTNLVNRRYLETRLAEEIKRSQRQGNPMSFMMIDVDEFKKFNDSFGHTEGDKALQLVAQCLRETLRGADVAARYGGEEFSILLPQTGLDEAVVIAERIRQRIENTTFRHRQVTVSIGVASCSSRLCDADKLISAADKSMYRAKSGGRNNVQIHTPTTEKNIKDGKLKTTKV
jgi:diguanylate cyclase (GGDEF)-like protein